MARWHYQYAGLKVASELHLPEWQPFATEPPDHIPDIDIQLGRAAMGTQTPALTAPRLTAEEYRFAIEGIGEYCVQGGRMIRITMYPDAQQREMRLFLLGSAWGALCYQRGILALHASVVEVHGQAIAFCGVSGAGKSSTAAWLVAQGYRHISDDLCHFDMRGTQPTIYPAAPRLKLWRDALDELGWQTEALERDHFRMNKFHVTSQPGESVLGEANSPIPLRAIYLLAWGEASLVRLKGIAALYQLVESATYRGDLLEPMGALAAHWQRCATLAANVPIFRFTRPADWSAMATAMQLLIDEWQVEPPKSL